jgi:hypothetical protein
MPQDRQLEAHQIHPNLHTEPDMETEKPKQLFRGSRIAALRQQLDHQAEEIVGLRMNQRKWVLFDDGAGDSSGQPVCPDCFERLVAEKLGDFHKVDAETLDPICKCADCGKEVRDA